MQPLKIDPNSVKGFLADDEGAALYEYAKEVSVLGPCLEVGSYCGKSTLYFGTGCQENGSLLYALDHHRGSEEHQLGEEYHDADLYDANAECLDSFREFRKNIKAAGLEDVVVPLVTSSGIAAKFWCTPLAMVFIDGGHSIEAAMTDYRGWAGHIMPGGILAIHDIFPDPSKGGQAPYDIYKLALASGLFRELAMVNTLAVLERVV